MTIFRTIRFRLFSVYSVIILMMLIAFFVAFYVYAKGVVETNEYKALSAQGELVANAVDANIEDAMLLAQRVLFSNTLKDLFYDKVFQDAIDYSAVREFYTLVNTIAGPQAAYRQMNIFSTDGRFISVGTHSTAMFFDVERLREWAWVDQAIALDGRRLVLASHGDFWNLHGYEVVSLVRSFPRFFGGKQENIIEIQMDSEAVFAAAMTGDASVHLFDRNGNQVFPLKSSEREAGLIGAYLDAYREAATRDATPYGVLNVKAPLTGRTDCVSVVPLDKADWLVAVAKPLDVVWKPVANLRNLTLVLSVSVLAVMLVVTYAVSRRITTPLTRIHRSIEELHLKMLPSENSLRVEKGLDELERLQMAYNDMTRKLSETLDEVVTARSMEMHAKMLALHAQMNPHFLFNTLSIISILAEERGEQQIMEIADHLISMFREILYEKRAYVTIRQELNYAEHYLKLLMVRFSEQLQYEIDVPERLLDVVVPHLVLQPIVENCAKYAADSAAPWRIHIEGTIGDGLWKIRVTDNGAGFSEEAMAYLAHAIEHPGDQMGLEKMGMLNICTRLKLMYRERAIFRFGNLSPHGAFVEIGGCLEPEVDHAAV